MFRWFALLSLAGCFGISTYYRRRARGGGETIPRQRETRLLKLGRATVALPMWGGGRDVPGESGMDAVGVPSGAAVGSLAGCWPRPDDRTCRVLVV